MLTLASILELLTGLAALICARAKNTSPRIAADGWESGWKFKYVSSKSYKSFKTVVILLLAKSFSFRKWKYDHLDCGACLYYSCRYNCIRDHRTSCLQGRSYITIFTKWPSFCLSEVMSLVTTWLYYLHHKSPSHW